MPAETTVRALSFHAGYGCRQTGACCSSNWPVPVEADRAEPIRAALADGRLNPATGDASAAIVSAAEATGRSALLLGRSNGLCVFFDVERPSCRVHARLGHEALPLACRQFPRVTVRDPRGVSVTLSHYCPTAAAMLDEGGPAGIVEGPAGFPADGEYEGLDASMAMPPLLRPDMMMDWDAWWDIEARAVDVLLTRAPADAMATLRSVVERLRGWEPRLGPLGGAIRAAFEDARQTSSPPLAPDWARTRIDEVVATASPDAREAHGAALTFAATAERVPLPQATVSRFLAAHAFANWHIQLGQGLRTWLRSVEAAHAFLVEGHGVRQADLWLRHLADVNRLATTWSRAES